MLEDAAERGRTLRQHRVRMGLTQVQVAEKLGVRNETLCRWERGRDSVPPMAVLALQMLLTRKLTVESVRRSRARRKKVAEQPYAEKFE